MIFPRPLLVAEIGSNHGGDARLAEAMVEAAASSGASAVKLQAFRVETLLHPESPYYAELKGEELAFPSLKELARLARRLGLKAGLTVFDFEGLDLAEEAGADFVKISSGDITHLPLIRKAAMGGRPLVLSTGASTWLEVARALRAAPRPLSILQCSSLYPAPPEAVNLAVMDRWLSEGLPAGLSDHCLGPQASLAAARLGAFMVERHFTIDKSLSGGDNSISSLAEDFSLMREEALKPPLSPEERLELASKLFWGLAEKAPQRGESPLLIRRAAVAARDLAKGERASIPNVAYLRPPGNLPSAPLGPAAEPPPTLLRAVPKGAVILEADVERPACR